jgi:hypothetical protein
MTTLTEKIAALEAELAALKAEADAEKPWPQEGDTFWVADLCGKVSEYDYISQSDDHQIFELGEAYRTKEEAERGYLRRKLQTRLQRLSEEAWFAHTGGKSSKPDWENNDIKYCLVYFKKDNKFRYRQTCWDVFSGSNTFPTVESVLAAGGSFTNDELLVLFDCGEV